MRTIISRLADLPTRVHALLVALLLSGAGYGAYTYLIAPKQAEASQLTTQIEQLLQAVQRGQIVEARLPQFRQDIARQREHLDNLRRILPEEKETAEIIRRVQQLAVESNLRIRSFTPQPTVRRDFYEDWPILMAVEGSYDGLRRFFEKVSKFTRIVNVENLSIKGPGESSGRQTLSATCTAVTFVYQEDGTQS